MAFIAIPITNTSQDVPKILFLNMLTPRIANDKVVVAANIKIIP